MPSFVTTDKSIQFTFLRRKYGDARFYPIGVLSSSSKTYCITDFSFELNKNGGCGVASITSSKNLSRMFVDTDGNGLSHKDQVQIYLHGLHVYTGYISEISRDSSGDSYTYSIEGYVNQLRWHIVTRFAISQQSLTSAIEDLIDLHISPVGDPFRYTEITNDKSRIIIPGFIPYDNPEDNTQQGWDGIIDDMVFQDKTIFDIMEVFQEIAGKFEWGIDKDRKLYFNQNSSDISQHYFVGNKDVILFEPKETVSDLATVAVVDCGTLANGKNLVARYESPGSIKIYGRREKAFSLPSAFPKYKDDDRESDKCLNQTPTTEGFNGLDTDKQNITDGNPNTYWKSNQEQKGGTRFWTTMASEAAIKDPGDNGGKGNGGRLFNGFEAGQLTDPIHAAWDGFDINFGGANYAGMDISENNFSIENGTVSIWWKPTIAQASLPANPIFFQALKDGAKKGECIGFGFNLSTGCFFIQNKNSVQYQATTATPYILGDEFYVSYAWEKSGKNLGAKQKLWVKHVRSGTLIADVEYSIKATPPKIAEFSNDYASIGASVGGANRAIGVLAHFKYFPYVKNYHTDYLVPSTCDAFQAITIPIHTGDNPYGFKIGEVILNSEGSDDDDHYVQGIKVEGELVWLDENGVATTWWETLYENNENSDSRLVIEISPHVYTKTLKFTCTGFTTRGDDEDDIPDWRIYSIEAYEFDDETARKWAMEELDKVRFPEKSATLVIKLGDELIETIGKIQVTCPDDPYRKYDLYEYDISKVTYRADNTVSIELGQLPDNVSKLITDLNRDLLMQEYQSQSDKTNYTTGSGYTPHSIPSSALGNINANLITAGSIQSANYNDGHGIRFNLNEARLWIREADGLVVYGAGGIQVDTNGSIRSVKTSYADTDEGFWIGYNGVAASVNIGDATSYMKFSGGSLELSGNIIARGGLIGKWVIENEPRGMLYKIVGDEETNAKILKILAADTNNPTDGPYIKFTQITDGNIIDVMFLGILGGYSLFELKDTTLPNGNSLLRIDGQTGNARLCGWLITNESISKTANGATLAIRSEDAGDGTTCPYIQMTKGGVNRVFIGVGASSNTMFRLRNAAGDLVCSIDDDSATICGWEITEEEIRKLDGGVGISLYSSDGGIIKVGDTHGNYVKIDGANSLIMSSSYAEGIRGWMVGASGNAEFMNVRVRGTLSCSVFEKNSVSSVGGEVVILPSDVLAADMTANDDSTLTIAGNVVFVVGDILRIKTTVGASVYEEWMVVSAVDGNNYTVERDKKETYAPNSNPVWVSGTVVVNYGSATDGGILLTSLDETPYIEVFITGATPWTSGTTLKVRNGNLGGLDNFIGGTLGADVYGLWTDSGYFKGTLFATAGYFGTNKKIEISDNGLIINSGGDITFYASSWEDQSELRFTLDGIRLIKVRCGFINYPPTTLGRMQIFPTNSISGILMLGAGGDESWLSIILNATESIYFDIGTSGFYFFDGALYAISSGFVSLGETEAEWDSCYLYDTLFCGRDDPYYGNDGSVYLYGNKSGSNGGKVRFYLANGYDGTIDYFCIKSYEDKLYIGTDISPNAWRMLATGDINMSGFLNAGGGFKSSGVSGINNSASGIPVAITISGGIVTSISKITGIAGQHTYSFETGGTPGKVKTQTFTNGILTAITLET